MKSPKREVIPVFFAVDDNYAPLLFVAIESLVSQASKAYEYHIHVLCDSLSDANKDILYTYEKRYLKSPKYPRRVKVFITDMAARIAARADQMHTRDYYSKTTYFRIYIPGMFPEYHKALYLDCDITLNGDISQLYNFDIGDNYVGAVTCEAVDRIQVFTEYAEKYLGLKLPHYFNAGVLVMNLDEWRSRRLEERFFDIMSKVKFEVAQDQDYLNVLCQGKTQYLPKVWNKIPMPLNGLTEADVKLVHYNLAFRPWRYDNVLYGDLFWKHAKKTAVYERLLEMKRGFTEKDAAGDAQWMERLKRMACELSAAAETFCTQIKSGKIVLIK